MSRISRDIYTSLDVNGPYIRIDTQPVTTTRDHNQNAVFTIAASIYYLTGDEAEIGDIDVFESDAVAPTDASLDNQTPGVPHKAKDNGYISYQWYEISVDPIDNSETVNKLTDGILYSGTNTTTLNVIGVLSPGYHLNRYYCELDYIPTLVNGEFDTGNAVNDIVTSDTVTLNVRPFLTITENPETNVIGLNPDIANFYTTATLSDTRTPWENYKLEYQWWEKDTLNAGDLPNIRLEDGDFRTTLSTERTQETILNETQRTTLTESVSSGRTKTVGIPTEAVSVTVTISGAEGGKGGDENRSTLGGLGGRGRDGKFSFSNSEIVSINNSGSPLEYKISSGSKGDDGSEGIVATGGLGGLSFDDNTGTDLNDSVFGGKGGDSGPGGVSGSGAGGGGGTGLIRYDGSWIAIAGAGGGGGGASEGAPGGEGLDAQSWQEFSSEYLSSEVQQATVVNYNPKAGTRQGGNIQDRIEYGIYIKSSSPISTVEVGVNYRVIVVWNNQEVISTTTAFAADSRGLYVQSGNVKYHISTHRGSQLGWCNNDDLTQICIRGEGEYANAFDVFTSSSTSSGQILPFDGGNGTSKILGDGGGGGGAGGGSNEPKSGGSPGADPIPSDEVDVIFKLFNNSDIGSNYIEFVEKPWYGFGSVPTDNRRIRLEKGSTTTQTVRLKTGHVYDVYSNFEDGGTPDQPARTSDTLRILQDLTPDANLREVIAGRSVGLSLTADAENIQTGNEDDFRDFIVSVSDGTFDVVPQTVRLDDDEILGKSIIRYTAPTSSINSVRSTGGEGGGSRYNSTSLVKFVGEGDGLSRGQGAVNMTIVTEQPYNVLEEEIIRSTITRNYSVRGAHPYTPYQETGFRSNLSITSDYIFSKRILCQVTVKDTSVSPASNAITSGPNTRYTTDADFIVTDSRDATITVEQIRQNDDFAIIKGLNLHNGDITFEKSNLDNIKETRYYSFYSNKDIEVDVQMYGGKGVDNGSYSGGNGGWSYLRLNMIANTEYVIAGLDDAINAPFLFKKGQLLACVGGGGNAHSNGPGGRGGGVNINGETAGNGGAGGISPISLTLNGILGSASLDPQFPDTREPYADSLADIPFGGRTTSCSKGNLYYFGGQPTPCQDRGSAVKFATGDGTLVNNTKEINRGFKAGYNIFNTAGRAPGISIVAGRGGCGALGGNGSGGNEYGGGGGSGYIAPDLVTDIFVRSEGNAIISDSSYTDSGKQGDGNDTLSSTLGGSNGPAKVIISRAEIPTRILPEFIERPANPLLDVSEEDVEREPNFIPLPEIVAPPPINPPNPRMSITSIVSKGFTGGDQTYTSFSDTTRINVLETGSVDISIKTEDIPPNTKFYWKVFRLPNSSGLYDDSDFDSVTGNFTTIESGSEIIRTFNISPDIDTETDFIGGNQDWYVKIYSDSKFKYQISPEDFTQKFRIKDNSLSAPVVTFDLNSDQSIAPFVTNTVIEGVSRTVNVNTQNIPHNDTIKWYINHNTTNAGDFVGNIDNGTINVTSGFTLDVDGVAVHRSGTLANAHLGTSSFTFATDEDQSSEGVENFGFQIEYPVGSGNIITNTLTGSGDDKKTFNLVDTSLVPVAEFSTTTTSIDEGSSFTFTLNTQHFFTGDTFFWKILSATLDDFTPITGEATVTETDDSSPSLRKGTASIKITTVADSTTEGPESYTLALYKDDSHTTNLNTVGNITHATTSFTVNDTSLGPREFGGFIDGLVRGNTNENDVALTFVPQAWNLTAAVSDNVTYYWQVLRSDTNTLPVTQSGWGAVGDDRTIEPEFNSIQGGVLGQFTFTRAGYTKTKGDISEGVVSPATGEYIFPYHVANTVYVSDDRVFSTIRDYLNDSDKSYYVAFYGSATDRTNKTNVLFETDTFTVTNSSPVYYAFNKNRGWGVTNTTGKNATNPTIIPEDNQIYYFRVETSAPVGTRLYYDTIGTDPNPASSDDFVRISSDDLPSPLDTSVDTRNAQEGSITTFDIDFVGNTNPTVDSGKIRSIAYIPVKILADEVTEGKKTFALSVYTLGGRTAASRVLIDTIEIEDSSINLPDSTVALKITNKGSSTTWSGSKSGANYSLTRSPGEETGIRLSWDITNADLIEDYDNDGNGFNSDYFITTDIIDLRDKPDWYTSSSYLEGTIQSADPDPGEDDDVYTLNFELEVQRRLGVLEDGPAPTSTSSITLRVTTTAPAALPVARISVDDSNIKMGEVVNIDYESDNGTAYALEKRTPPTTGTYGPLVASPGYQGTATDQPLSNTQYRYTVTGDGGTDQDEVTVYVSAPDAPTASLSINTETIQSGGTAYLSWSGTGEYISSQSLTRTKDGSSVTVSSSLTGDEVGDSPTELGDYTYKFSVTNPNSTANAYAYLTVEAVPADDPPVPFIRVDNTTPAKNSSVVITYGGNKGTHDLSSGVLYIAQSGNGSQSILNPAGVSDPPGTELQYTYNLSNLPSWVELGSAKFEYRLKDSNNVPRSAFVDINIQGNIDDPIKCNEERAINTGKEEECIYTTFYHAKPVNRYQRVGGGSKPRFMHHPFGPGSNISGYAPPSHTSGGDDAPHGKKQPLFFREELKSEENDLSIIGNGTIWIEGGRKDGGYQLPSTHTDANYRKDVIAVNSRASIHPGWSEDKWNRVWSWHWGRAMIRFVNRGSDLWDYNDGQYKNKNFSNLTYDTLVCGAFPKVGYDIISDANLRGYPTRSAKINTNLSIAARPSSPGGGRRPEKDYGGDIGVIEATGFDHYVGLDGDQGHEFYGWPTYRNGNAYAHNEFSNSYYKDYNQPVKVNPDFDLSLDPNRWPYQSMAWFTERDDGDIGGIPHFALMDERIVIVCDRTVTTEVADRNLDRLGHQPGLTGSGQRRFLTKLHDAQIGSYHYSLNYKVFPNTIAGEFAQGTPAEGVVGLNDDNIVKIESADGVPNFSGPGGKEADFPKITWDMPKPDGIYHYLNGKFYNYQQTNYNGVLPDWHPYYDENETDNNRTIRTIKNHPTN